MANKLKGLKITSTDLVDAGANPDAHVQLFKRNEPSAEGKPSLLQQAKSLLKRIPSIVVNKEKAVTFAENVAAEHLRDLSREMFDYCYAFSDSLCSIIFDGEMEGDAKRDMMFTSLDEFTEAVRNTVPKWSQGKQNEDISKIEKSAGCVAAFDVFWGEIQKAANTDEPTAPDVPNTPEIPDTPDTPDTPPATTESGTTDEPQNAEMNKSNQEEETDTMKIDKSKLNAEELATLTDLEKRYGTDDEPAATPAPATSSEVEKGLLHPEVQKALDEMNAVKKAQTAEIEELRKSLELSSLTNVAKKYEIIGKKADELAPKLYDLKKADAGSPCGSTVYDDYVALLDEQATLVEKSGIFTEIGKNTSGGGADGKLTAAVTEIQKSNNGMSRADAIIKAFEENPELANEYENGYGKGGNR